jgi:hypothetical protein
MTFTFLPLCPKGKSPHYPLDTRRDSLQSQCRHCGKERILVLLGLEHWLSSPLPVTTFCELSSVSMLLLVMLITWLGSQIKEYEMGQTCTTHEVNAEF